MIICPFFMQLDKGFTYQLLEWYKKNKRTLPWQKDKNVYKIWISEIILQQTRVEQGTPYYTRFINRFPSLNLLAKASLDEVLKLWEGLGYYSRARNLHFTAKYIFNELNGEFPRDYEGLLMLKGIGPYSAAAIAGFAYNLPHPVVDGNVVRFIARLLGIYSDKNASKTHTEIRKLLTPLIEDTSPSAFNQALMDYGSLVCAPKNAKCLECVFQEECYAFNSNKVYQLPIKKNAKKKNERYLTFMIWRRGDMFALEKRDDKEIWKSLYQFPLLQTSREQFESKKTLDYEDVKIEVDGPFVFETKHILSHQKLFIRIVRIPQSIEPPKNKSWKWKSTEEIKDLAFPVVLKKYIEQELKGNNID